MRRIILASALPALLSSTALAQGIPCYTPAACAAIRQQAEQQQAAQAAAYAAQQEAIARQQREEVRAAERRRLAAEQAARQAQADRDEAARRARIEAEDRAAAQLVAESSPNNHCKEPKIAGELMTEFNSLQAVQDRHLQSVDIEHLTTIKFDPENLSIVCHGVFVLSNGRRLPGTLSTRPNVAGNAVISFSLD